MIVDDYISVSRACKNKNLSVKKVLDYLTANSLIPKAHKKQEFIIHKPIEIISTGDTLKIIEDQFISYLEKDNALYDLSFNDETTDVMDMVVDVDIRFKRLQEEIKGEKLCFIDAEFKDGNYHEIAYEIVVDGVVIEKDYIMERNHYINMVKKGKTIRYDRLKSFGKTYKVLQRKHINRILKTKLKDVKYIIAHNAYGERNILTKNGMQYEKAKYICTSKLSDHFVLGYSPSLKGIIEHYKLPYDSHFMHYAFEDTRMAKEVFYRMIEDYNERQQNG